MGGRLLLVVVLAGVWVSSAQASSPRLSASAYRAKANALCGAFKKYDPPPGTVKQRIIGEANQFFVVVAEYESLRPPASFDADRAQLVALDHQASAQLKSIVARLKAGKITTKQALNGLVKEGPLGKEQDVIWARMGVKVCAAG